MKPVVVLTLVGVISAFLLSVADDMTREPIALAKEKMKREAIEKIFPFKFDSLRTVRNDQTTFYEAYDNSMKLQGVAVEVSTDKGYSGKIEVLLGISPEAKVYTYKVLAHTETPGLGDKIDNPKFKRQFENKGLDGLVWKVKKDGGFVDELTAATISSRAITDAVEKGLILYKQQYSKLTSK